VSRWTAAASVNRNRQIGQETWVMATPSM
jgi:hypothetical protein